MKDVIMSDNGIDVISTSDFWLTTTLHALGVGIDGIDNIKSRATFYFVKTPYVNSLVERYFAGKLKVDPLRFQEVYRALNAQLHTRNTKW